MCLLHVLSERKSISFDTEVNCNKKTGQAMKAQVVSIFFHLTGQYFQEKDLESLLLYTVTKIKSIDRTKWIFWHCKDRSQFEEDLQNTKE